VCYTDHQYVRIGAAEVIRDRLATKCISTTHCHHCSWTFYLAGLVCWLYGFALQSGWQTSLITSSEDTQTRSSLPEAGLVHAGFTTEACETYLNAAISGIQHRLSSNGSSTARMNLATKLKQTQGVLVTLADMLEKHTEGRRGWLIEDAVVSLRRLSGVD
jgi:hypothetical protein